MKYTSLQDRVTIGELAAAGCSDQEIAEHLGWQPRTVRKWRRRLQTLGRAGLVSKMGRPAQGALSSFSEPVAATLRHWREGHPRWGPLTLRVEATQDRSLAGQRLPSRTTIARWLKAKRLTHSYQRHWDLAQSSEATAQAAHEAWEMDAYGTVSVPDVGKISLINVNDCFSHAKLLSFPCLVGDARVERHADTADYLLVLRLTFVNWGLPQQLRVDRDSIYRDNTSKSPFPTRLHLFLLGLGIELVIGPAHQPRKRAITERTHQTWAWQVLEGQTFVDWDALWRALEARREFLNHSLPCRACDNLPPLVAHPQAAVPRRPYDPQDEPAMFDLDRIAAYLAQGEWFRKASNVGVVTIGDQHYTLGQQWAKHEVQVTCDPTERTLIFLDHDALQTKRLPIKGISYTELAGDMGRLFQLHPYQLPLPFTWSERRLARLCETLSGTT
jgi:hypothetical protein